MGASLPQIGSNSTGSRRAALDPTIAPEVPVSVAEVGVTAVTTLIAVALGGWLTSRAQERIWQRDHQRQWRDIRLTAYTGYLTAFREYVAYILQPATQVLAVPRPREPHDLMPFFDEAGSAYKERMEAAKTALRLISGRPGVVRASNKMVRYARMLAADRATCKVDEIPPERFEGLWSAEREFVLAAREELGLANDFEIGDRPAQDADTGQGSYPPSRLAAWVPDPAK
jgi:hypothetical protein